MMTRLAADFLYPLFRDTDDLKYCSGDGVLRMMSASQVKYSTGVKRKIRKILTLAFYIGVKSWLDLGTPT